MARQARRVEPLPDPFRLPPAGVGASRLAGRVVFVACADPAAAATAVRQVQQAAGRRRVVVTESGLFDGCLERPWGAFQLPSDIGLAPLLDTEQFLTALRGLADDLLVELAPDADIVVDVSPGHATDTSVRAIRSLYPDAVVVTDDGRTEPEAGHAEAGRPAAEPARPADRLVVILGCGRSGTTWLQQLWLAHDGVAGLEHNESWLFHQLRHVWRKVEQREGFARHLGRSDVVTVLRRFTDRVLSDVAVRFGGDPSAYVVEKSPVHVPRLAEITAVHPDAWFVHLVRDGRDVARSITQVPFFETPDLGGAAAMWRDAVDTVRRQQHLAPRFRDVRYEDLAADPESVMTSLWSWVGLPVTEASLVALRAAIGPRVSAHGRTTTTTGSWRGMSSTEVDEIYRVAGDTLVREGYARRRELWLARLHRARKSSTAAENASGRSTQGK